MKRSLSFGSARDTALVVAGTSLIAATYGLVRLAYGLLLPDIDASLGVGPVLAGAIASGGSVAYCLGALAGLAAPTQDRRLVAGAVLTGALGAVGTAAAPDAVWLAASAVLASAGAGLASPGLVGLIGRNVATAGAGRAQATVNAGTGPGLVVAGALALALSPQWRVGFAVAAACTCAAGIAVLVLDRSAAAPPRDDVDAPQRRRSWGALVRPGTAALLLGAGSAVVWTYGRSLLVDRGASDVVSTAAWIALGVGGMASVASARALTAVPPARAWALTSACAVPPMVLLATYGGHLVVAMAACVVFGWAYVAASSALIAWAGESWPHDVPAGTAVLLVALVLGQAAGATAAGALADAHGLRAASLAGAATTLAGCLPSARRREPDDDGVVCIRRR